MEGTKPSSATMALHIVLALLILLYAAVVWQTGHLLVSGKLFGDIYRLNEISRWLVTAALLSAAVFMVVVPYPSRSARYVCHCLLALSFLLFTIGFFLRAI